MASEKKVTRAALQRLEEFLLNIAQANPAFIDLLREQYDLSHGEHTHISGGTDLYKDNENNAAIHDNYSLVPKKLEKGVAWFVNLCRETTYRGFETRGCTQLTLEEFHAMYGDEVLNTLIRNTEDLLALYRKKQAG